VLLLQEILKYQIIAVNRLPRHLLNGIHLGFSLRWPNALVSYTPPLLQAPRGLSRLVRRRPPSQA